MTPVVFSYLRHFASRVVLSCRTLLLMFFLSLSSVLLADEWVNTQYNTAEGSEFWVTFMSNSGAAMGDTAAMKLFLYASAREHSIISITNPSTNTIPITFEVSANKQAFIQVPNDWAYIGNDEANKITQRGILVTSTNPISLYATNQHSSGKYDATNVLPVLSLTNEYVVQTYRADSYATEFVIVSTYAGQQIDINIRKTTIDQDKYNNGIIDTIDIPEEYTLQKTFDKPGQTYLFRATEQLDGGVNIQTTTSLSGTTICSSAPFALFVGGQSAKVPSDPENHIFSQAYPTDKWGKEFYVTPTYGMVYDYVQFTACENNTQIRRDGNLITTINAKESYIDTIKSDVYYSNVQDFLAGQITYIPNVAKYTTSRPTECYLYGTSNSANHPSMDGSEIPNTTVNFGAPTLTPIIPQELAMKSAIISTFTKNNTTLYHYINIVTQTSEVKNMRLDEIDISNEFLPIIGSNYSYAIIQISDSAHKVENVGKNYDSKFTARVYGMGKSSSATESYAYAAGSRVNRPVDMLINDKYINYLKVCINDNVKFTSLIGYKYDELKWEIFNDQDSLVGSSIDSIYNHTFTTSGLHDVLLHVYSHTPICDYQLEDIVTAKIFVDTLTIQRPPAQQRCIGDDRPFELLYKGDSILLAADTASQTINGETFKLRFDTEEEFVEIIDQDSTCDIRLIQTLWLRRTYNNSFDTTACDEWIWVDSLSKNRKNYYDTIQVFTIEPEDKLPVWKEHTHNFNSKYGCDSIVTWRVCLNKSYDFIETFDTCQTPGGVYKWEGHDTIHIPLDNPGEFTYTDYLTTREEPYCDSIHRLILTVHPIYDTTEVVTICQNDTFTWSVNDQRYVGGKYPDIQPNDVIIAGKEEFEEIFTTTLYGCDSIHRLEITVLPSYDTTYIEEICDNQTYQLNDSIVYSGNKSGKTGIQVSAQAEAYHFTHDFKTKDGCDSIIHLELYVHPTYEEVLDTAVCQVAGGTFEWVGHRKVPIDKVGTFQYIDSLTTQHGCDNIYVLNLTVHPTFYSEQDTVLSNEDYIQWQGKVIGGKDVTSVALDYRVTKDTTIQLNDLTIHGCDDIHVLNITYGEVFRDTVYGVACDNDSIYEWYYNKRKLKDIAVPTTASTYWFNETLKSPIGIDSLIYLELTVFPTYRMDTIDSICTTLPYSWRALDDDGNTNWIYDVQNECMIDAGNIPTTLPAGQQMPQTFVYIDSLKTEACSTCPENGCDSIFVLHLTVLPQYEHIDTLAVCDNDSITWNGEWFYGYKLGKTTRSVTNDTLIERPYSNEHGCESYMKLQLYVLPTYLVVASTDTIYQHICENETYTTNYGKEYNKNAEWSTPDHVVSRYVIVDTIQRNACSECYGLQCDSVVAHVVYVHPTYEYITIDTICQRASYTWKVMDAEGNTIEITNDIVDPNGHAINTIETDTYGTFEYLHINTTTDMLQCDSIHKLLLTILPRENTIDTLSMCDNDSILWYRNGTWLYGDKSGANAAQTYAAQDKPHSIEKSANNAYGCDYKEILYLFVKAHSTADTTITICEDNLPYIDSHTNQLYYQSTDYYDTIVNHIGCDSIIHVNLLVTDTFHTHIDTTICESDAPYYHSDKRAQNLQQLNQSGIYYDTIPTHLYGCDSILILNLTINPTTIFRQTISWCQSAGPYSNDNKDLENLQNLTKSGIYRDTLKNVNQYDCDSIVEITLEIMDSIVVHEYDTICDNYLPYYYPDTAAHKLQEIWNAGVYRDTLISKLNGCDSVIVLHLHITPTYTEFKDTTICQNQTPCIWKTKDIYGEYTRVINLNDEDSLPIIKHDSILLKSVHGCDSLVYLSLTICPTYSKTEFDTICQLPGGVYQWEGHKNTIYSDTQKKLVAYIPLDSAGTFTYIDSLKTDTCKECGSVGCDSIHYLYLTILPTYRIVDTIVKISEEEIFYWEENDKTYGGQKTIMPHDSTLYNDTTIIELPIGTNPIGTHSCDSIRVLEIIIGKVYRDTLKDEVCSNTPYKWIGKDQYGNDSVRMTIEHPQTMVYKDEHTTEMGFDSIFYLDLTVYPAYVEIDSMIIRESTCQYSEYTWKRHNTDIPSKELFSMDQQQWIDANHIPTDVVGTFIYIDSMTTINGCDSVYTLILDIQNTYAITDTIDICTDTFAIWQDTIYVGTKYTGQLPNDSMSVITLSPQTNYNVNRAYKSISGCDSIRYLCLNIHPLYDTIDCQTICDTQNPYIWETHDSYAKSMGIIYRDTIAFEPSILKPDSTKDVTYIDTIYRTLTSVHGCDSVVQLHLTIYPTYEFVTPARICSNDSIEWRGRFFNGTGADTIVIDYDTTQYGCDSIYTLNLQKIPEYEEVYPYYLCANHPDTVYHYYNENKDSSVIWIPNANPLLEEKKMTFKTKDSGCDSIIIYKFHYFPIFHEATTHTICSTDTVQIHSDYIFTLPETQKNVDPENETVFSIDTVIRDTIYSPNTYMNEYGEIDTCYCSSTYEATIRIYPAFKHVDSVTICSNEEYIWYNDTIRNLSEGDYHYTKTDTSIDGCDSIYELQLHVNPIYNNINYDTICNCDTYIFKGDTLRYSGLYHDTTQSVLTGCDSISTLHLIVYDTTLNVVYDTICSPEKYEFLDSTFTKAGIYGFISTNLWGCRHHDSLYLTVVDTTAYDLYIGDVLCADDEELMVEYQVLSGPELIEYSVLFDAVGHAQGFEDIYHAPLDPMATYFTIPIPKGEVLPHPNPTYFDSQQGVNDYIYEDKYDYPLPGIQYNMTIIMHNGICGDTLQMKDTTFSFYYPSWIHEQHWNDGVVLYNNKYNGGHIFTEYQWYQNGEAIVGATKEYLYIPKRLLMNERGECDNYYQVELKRLSDGVTTMTCPICPVLLEDTIVPTKDYFSVVPTMVVKENPVVHILSTQPGTYEILTVIGMKISEGSIPFSPNDYNYATSITIPDAQAGTIRLIRLTLHNGESRVFVILIK